MLCSRRSNTARSGGDILGLLSVSIWAVGLLLAVPCEVEAEQALLSVVETEALVRARYYEGLPEEAAARIGVAGCARLLEMLSDPADAESHAQILLAIGICGPGGALEAIAGWVELPRSGEIDRASFRAWQALPFALGHLADHDPRAVARLAARLEDSTGPEWTFRHHRGARLVKLKRRAAASCLAETGLPAARAALDRAGRRASDGELRTHLEDMRARHAEVAARRAARGGRR